MMFAYIWKLICNFIFGSGETTFCLYYKYLNNNPIVYHLFNFPILLELLSFSYSLIIYILSFISSVQTNVVSPELMYMNYKYTQGG